MRNTLYAASRNDWRAWLAKNGQSETELWLLFYKKHTGQPCVSYEHAVEEALCFGWIDSIVKRLDDDRYAQKFTPRRDGSQWSASNKRRLRKLLDEGRMTDAGLAKIDRALLEEQPAKPGAVEESVPADITRALMANTKAWKNFSGLAPSRRRAYVRLILDAKREETRERRVREVISRLEQNTGDPDDIPPFLERALKRNARAWHNFLNLDPSHRRQYVGWIMHAKKEDTRERRLREAVVLLAQNRKLGLK
jgi:uncharacterized protein YdeI (YjbR/CyaY-like superfamily)